MEIKKISLSPIERACYLAGGQSRLARILGIAPPTLNQWIKGIRPIPIERCIQIEKATNRLVTCEELYPALDWAYLRGSSKGKQKK